MTTEILDAMKNELSRWQTRLGELRVKANLGKMEVRDKLDEFEAAYDGAKDRLSEWKKKGEVEWDASLSAVESGWESLRDTYREVKKKADSV